MNLGTGRTAVVAGALLLAACGGGDGDESIMATVMCEDFVEQRLRAPATAGFPLASDQDINRVGTDTYHVESHVDAENGFGAEVRTSYSCTVVDEGDTWRLEALELDGEPSA